MTLGALTVLDLTDDAKWRVIELDEPNPDIEREYRASCGSAGTRLVKRRLKSETIPLKVYFRGATADAAFTNRDSFINRLLEAVAYQTNDTESDHYVAAATYFIRGIDNQDPKDFWTVLDFNARRIRKAWDMDEKVGYLIDLVVYPGQMLPGGV